MQTITRQTPKPQVPAIEQLLATLTKLSAAQCDLRDALSEQVEAMKRLDVKAMASIGHRQESAHRRLLKLEGDRRRHGATAAGQLGLAPDTPLVEVVSGYPDHAEQLLQVRDELRAHTIAAADLGRHCARIAGGVLGHVNGALRLVTKSCLYGREGGFELPPVSHRIRAIG